MIFLGCDKESFETKPVEFVFYIPNATTQYNFGIIFNKYSDNNCNVQIFEAPILQDGETVKTGDKVILFYPELLFEIDVWIKYYYPKFCNKQYQWYHKQDYNDEIQAMAEVMEYSRKKAVDLLGGV